MKREIELSDLLSDYDWASVFGEESNGGNCTTAVETLPPEAELDRTAPSRSDVAEIIAAVNGENDGDEWIGVFRLNDGRYLAASGSCDYTGWD